MSAIAETSPRNDLGVIRLVGLAHGSSHYFQLVLPPLFPLLTAAYGVGYAELGLLMAVFSVASGLMQTPAGFLVDRFGAATVLPIGLATLAGSVVLIGLVPQFWMMIPLMITAGCGNSVFHPCDYAVLSHRVSAGRLARAYAVHTTGGVLGWAGAFASMTWLAADVGFHAALGIVGAIGLALAGLLVLRRGDLEIPIQPRHERAAMGAATLLSRPVVLCFVYFLLLSVAMAGVSTFVPAALMALHATPLDVANRAPSVYLAASALGSLAGGWFADRTSRHERIVALGLLIAGIALYLAGFLALEPTALMILFAIGGFFSGTTTPSRDMLVRSATPPGSTGRVFGFVYSGLDLGNALTPPLLGLAIDGHAPALVFQTIAGALILTIISAQVLKRGSPPRLAPLAP